ncbi:MAG: hypothetical protein MIO87_02080 [Methanomassiliicoccales archaeon]|nr:hypothetical protein [Methanomassiliicoccales archaeon]TFG55259.1 MAG: hypothetical protein E4H30_07625 [Methanomassiliicoccus sp.]
MIIVQIAGFLGSGKTTFMIRLGRRLGELGKRTVAIVNEIGEVGIDGDVLESHGLKTVELTEGCICCSLSGSLQNTLKMVKKEFSPDYILIEPTGLALPNRINRIIRTSMVEPEKVITIALVDAFRADDLIRETKAFLTRQVEDADIVAINKVDMIDPSDLLRIIDMVEELDPRMVTVQISARTGSGVNELVNKVGIV